MMLISISAMFNQLSCLGVWWNSILSTIRRATSGGNASGKDPREAPDHTLNARIPGLLPIIDCFFRQL
jgi:hypothetical protein